MTPWLERLSIRARIVALVLAILLPVAAILAWYLAIELRQARAAADAKVTILADNTAAELERLLQRAQALLSYLAERPLVKALDPGRCDPLIAESIQLDPEPEAFGLLGMQERVRALGAVLRIHSLPGSGTTIDVNVPAAVGAFVGPAERPADDDAARPDARATDAGRLLAGVIDALDGSVAVLDRHGVILHVNRAWQAFATLQGSPDMRACGPGADCLDVCRHAAPADAIAAATLRGLTTVLEGREISFSIDYPCDTPNGRLWFRMHAAPVDDLHVLVTHTPQPEPTSPPSERARSH